MIQTEFFGGGIDPNVHIIGGVDLCKYRLLLTLCIGSGRIQRRIGLHQQIQSGCLFQPAYIDTGNVDILKDLICGGILTLAKELHTQKTGNHTHAYHKDT